MTAGERTAHTTSVARAFNDGDVDTFVALLAPEIEHVTLPDEPDAGIYHGRDGVRELVRLWNEMFDDLRLEHVAVEAVGDRHAILCSRLTGRGRASGMDLDAPYVFAYRFGRALPDRVVEFRSREEATAAIEADEV